METTTVILILFAASAVAVTLVFLRLLRELRALKQADPSGGLLMLQNQIEGLRETTRSSLEGGRLEIDRRLEDTNRVVGEVREGLGQVDRQIRSVNEATRDLRSLQELLRSPKARGGMGELLLGELLAQVLPQAHFTLQYQFPSGERVDAALRIGDGLVPVDAKFPLENFQRLRTASRKGDAAAEKSARRDFFTDARRHVDAIASRYILPEHGTYEFAMMYLPAEAIYQELLEQSGDDGLDLFHYALSRKVVPVSPQSFYAYLQVIVLGMRGLTIEARARDILQQLGGIRGRLERFGDSFELAARHLANAQKQTDEASRRLAQLDAAIANLAEGETQTEVAGAGEPTSVGEGDSRLFP